MSALFKAQRFSESGLWHCDVPLGTGTQTSNLPFKIVPANRWPFSGTEAKSHRGGSRAGDYSEEGKEEEGRSNRKNTTTQRKLERLTIWCSFGRKQQ